ncbi:MAG: hypothetical protein DRJ57_02285 [Thermoprotei archaeon]|nr:MAG: hypothetical protein DRJ57_02285 [Thermoprotei archaeon]
MLVVDYRERGSRVVRELERLGAPLKFEKLDVGDYLVSTDTCIERKTCNDFLSSIVDKRLFEQARYMRQAYAKPILVVEGDFERALLYRRFNYPQVYGALAALLDMGVHVLRTQSAVETAYTIFYLYKRSVERRNRRYLPPAKIKVIKSNKSLEVVQLNLIATIPGLSYELAHRILMYFKTPRRFFKASPAELRRVKGLGSSRIARIVEILDTIYPPLAMGSEEGDGSE